MASPKNSYHPLKNSGIKKRDGFSGRRLDISCIEFLKNSTNGVDEIFYDDIKFDCKTFVKPRFNHIHYITFVLYSCAQTKKLGEFVKSH
jgi:hypothetical protein